MSPSLYSLLNSLQLDFYPNTQLKLLLSESPRNSSWKFNGQFLAFFFFSIPDLIAAALRVNLSILQTLWQARRASNTLLIFFLVCQLLLVLSLTATLYCAWGLLYGTQHSLCHLIHFHYFHCYLYHMIPYSHIICLKSNS